MDGIGELGQTKNWTDHGIARRRLALARTVNEETQLKAARNYGAAQWSGSTALPTHAQHQHFGPMIISCDHADLRPTPHGVWIDGHMDVKLEALQPPVRPRIEVIDEFYNAIVHGKPVLHSGAWARATTAVGLAILASSESGQIQTPLHQVAPDY